MDTLLDALRDDAFAAGLRPGLIALAAGGLLWLATRSGGRRAPLPVAGAFLAAATLAGLDEVGSLPGGLVLAVVLLLAGGLVADFVRLPLGAPVALAVPGAWVLATRTDLVDVGWIRLLVGLTAVTGAALVADFDHRWRKAGAAPPMWAVSAFGVYLTVPDTEQALVLLGASVPVALLGWPWPLASLGAGGSAAAVGLLAWTAAAGGYGRESSIVGAVACLGLLVAEPVAARLSGGHLARRRGPGLRWTVVAVGAAHAVVVAFASRVAGLRATVPPAAALAAAALVVAVAATAVAARRAGRPLGARFR